MGEAVAVDTDVLTTLAARVGVAASQCEALMPPPAWLQLAGVDVADADWHLDSATAAAAAAVAEQMRVAMLAMRSVATDATSADRWLGR